MWNTDETLHLWTYNVTISFINHWHNILIFYILRIKQGSARTIVKQTKLRNQNSCLSEKCCSMRQSVMVKSVLELDFSKGVVFEASDLTYTDLNESHPDGWKCWSCGFVNQHWTRFDHLSCFRDFFQNFPRIGSKTTQKLIFL